MGKKWTKAAIRESAVAEYLKGGQSRRAIGKKYGVSQGAVNRWLANYYALMKKSNPKFEIPKAYSRPVKPEVALAKEQQALPKEVRQLQEELRKARLHNELLQTMIDIAEKDLGIDIRKKSGTKRS